MKTLLCVVALVLVAVPSQAQTGWSEQIHQNGSDLTFVDAVDMNIGWAVGKYGGPVMRTTNGGATWSMCANPEAPGYLWGVQAINANTAMVFSAVETGGNTAIWRTTDAGQNWLKVYGLTEAGAFIDGMVMVNATVGYALGDPVGGKWLFLKTTDGGATWSRLNSAPAQAGAETGMLFSFATYGTTQLWFGSGLKMYHSTNGGLNWTYAYHSDSPVTSFASLHFADPLHGVSTSFFGNYAMWTEDGGVTWTDVELPGSGESGVTGLRGDFFITRGKSIYQSGDGGKTWPAVFTHTGSTPFAQLSFADMGSSVRGWAVAWGGPIVTYTQIPTGVNTGLEEGVPSTVALLPNYPNPFNPSTVITYVLPDPAEVRLSVYDMLGREVATLVEGLQGRGVHKETLDASGLASGPYVCRLQTASTTVTRKLMLVR
jgi:photosystem II stability/assembly factor-like uncharacterized protein